MVLKDIAEFNSGFGYKMEDLVEHSETRIARITNLYDLFVDINYIYIPDENYDKYKKYELIEGDIVLTIIGSWPDKPKSVVGQLYRVPANAGHIIMARNMLRIRSNGMCCQDYLYYLLSSEHFRKYCLSIMKGSAKQAALAIGDIEKYEVDIPCIEEQQRQVSILKDIDQQIENNKAINRKLQEIKDLLIQKEFGKE